MERGGGVSREGMDVYGGGGSRRIVRCCNDVAIEGRDRRNPSEGVDRFELGKAVQLIVGIRIYLHCYLGFSDDCLGF